MFNKESLYINAIKYDNGQLKLDYKKIIDDKIVETSNSTFLADSDIIPIDIAHKLNSSQAENQKTYISTLLMNDRPTIQAIGEAVNSKDFESSQFNQEFNIITTKESLSQTSNYFHLTGLDFIYSAFHIMNLHLEANVCNNEILIFLFNNKAYILIVNENSSITYHGIEELVTFENIKKTHFYNSDIDGQMLFDEIYFFELNSIIEKTLLNYDEKIGEKTIKKIRILYTVKQLSNEQLEQIKEQFLINVEYHPINVDEEVFELSKNKHFKKSFIKPRKKKSKISLIWFIIILISMIATFVGFKYGNSILEYINTKNKEQIAINEKKIDEIKPEIEKIEEKKETIIPDHVNLNDIIYNKINTIFASIPYDAILKDIKIEDNSVILTTTLLNDKTFEKSLKSNLEKLYKIVQFDILEKDKKFSIDTVITLKDEILSLDIDYKKFNGKYNTKNYNSLINVNDIIKNSLPNNAIIKNNGENEIESISKFSYKINLLVKSPLEFFNLIDKINLGDKSINLTYPIIMKKTANGIEIEFNLIYNQLKK